MSKRERHISAAKFSGGRSSAVMVKTLLDAGRAPDHIIFCNTGLESDETYSFIAAVQEQWFDGRLTMLERQADGTSKVIERVEDLDREGGPMRAMVEANKLPTRNVRVCTGLLKVHAALRHLYSLVPDYRDVIWESYVGLRADEPRRLARLRAANEAVEARINAGKPQLKWTDLCYAPLADRGIGRSEVLRFFKDHPLRGLGFDPADERIRLSNCLGCFFGNDAAFIDVAQRHPRIAKFWDEMERIIYAKGRHLSKPSVLALRRKLLARLGAGEPADDYEATAYGTAKVPWKVYIRIADASRPVQPDLVFEGGCESGECGVDL